MLSNSERKADSTTGRFWRYAPLLIWTAIIFLGSTNELSAINTSRITRPLLMWLFPGMDERRITLAQFFVRKGAHFTEYAILGWLAARAFVTSSHRFMRRKWFLAAALLVVVYALLDEFHQSFVPSRTPSLYDSLIDTIGGLAALISFRYFQRTTDEGQ